MCVVLCHQCITYHQKDFHTQTLVTHLTNHNHTSSLKASSFWISSLILLSICFTRWNWWPGFSGYLAAGQENYTPSIWQCAPNILCGHLSWWQNSYIVSTLIRERQKKRQYISIQHTSTCKKNAWLTWKSWHVDMDGNAFCDTIWLLSSFTFLNRGFVALSQPLDKCYFTPQQVGEDCVCEKIVSSPSFHPWLPLYMLVSINLEG